MLRIFAALLLALSPGPGRAQDVTVFAAASLMTAMEQVAAAYHQANGGRATVSYAGSSALARQIQQGAPADVFISANTAWMDALEADGLIDPATRRDLLTNRLVLIAHGTATQVNLGPDTYFAELLDGGRLAMALVEAVPAGLYGKAALQSLGLWEDVAGRVAQADNVRAALALVAAGAAPLGIVYATDAAAEPRVSVVATFPADSHPPIVYPVAATTRAGDGAAAFLDFLDTPPARVAFARQGFGLTAP